MGRYLCRTDCTCVCTSYGIVPDEAVHGADSGCADRSSKIDGAKEGRIFLQIVMPNVKPAWLTVTIFSVQNLWDMKGQIYIYSEEFKMLPYALQQIMSAGVARAGVGSAATMVVMMVPIIIFVAAQSNILETMASSGIKD